MQFWHQPSISLSLPLSFMYIILVVFTVYKVTLCTHERWKQVPGHRARSEVRGCYLRSRHERVISRTTLLLGSPGGWWWVCEQQITTRHYDQRLNWQWRTSGDTKIKTMCIYVYIHIQYLYIYTYIHINYPLYICKYCI